MTASQFGLRDGLGGVSPGTLMEKKMRRPITKILRKLGCGFVLTEMRDEVFFGSYALDGNDIDELEEGQWAEFELYGLDIPHTIFIG